MATMASTCDCCHGTFAERNLLIYIYIYTVYIRAFLQKLHQCHKCVLYCFLLSPYMMLMYHTCTSKWDFQSAGRSIQTDC